MAAPHLFRVIVQFGDIEVAAAFYARVLGIPGERVDGMGVWVVYNFANSGIAGRMISLVQS